MSRSYRTSLLPFLLLSLLLLFLLFFFFFFFFYLLLFSCTKVRCGPCLPIQSIFHSFQSVAILYQLILPIIFRSSSYSSVSSYRSLPLLPLPSILQSLFVLVFFRFLSFQCIHTNWIDQYSRYLRRFDRSCIGDLDPYLLSQSLFSYMHSRFQKSGNVRFEFI